MELFIGLKRGLRFAVPQCVGKTGIKQAMQDSYEKGPANRLVPSLSRNTLLHECCRP
jgi:hypothetical protein